MCKHPFIDHRLVQCKQKVNVIKGLLGRLDDEIRAEVANERNMMILAPSSNEAL
jgi:hypothetical protein